jgi:penicillin amidase
MSWTKKFLLFFLIVFLLSVLGLYIFFQLKAPKYEGSETLIGVNEQVKIHYDDYGIPHILAQSESDAFFALGYAHATDRLFQMELLRRLASGRLAEILGPELVPVDELFLTLGLLEHAKASAEEYKKKQPSSYEAMTKYLEGVNAYIERSPKPIEFHLMGIPKMKFTLEDCFSITGYMAFTFAPAIKTDPHLTHIYNQYGPKYLEPLTLNWPKDKMRIPVLQDSSKSETEPILKNSIGKVMDKIPVGLFHGSNGIVLSAKRSTSGKPILVNDTHIKYSQPTTWFEAHLEYPGHSIYGNYIAGFPFPIIGHNNHHSWGMTMLQTDDMDFYIEEYNPNNPLQVRFDSTWETMDTLHHVIPVKKSDTIHLTVHKTRHGPLVNDVIKEVSRITAKPVSISWGYTHQLAKNPEATYRMAISGSMEEVRQAASMIHSPPISLMYADVEGNIAWWSMAKIAIRPDHVNTKIFLDGASGKDEIIEYLDFSRNPHMVNPPSGVIITANNQPAEFKGFLHPGYFLPASRYERLHRMISEKELWNSEELGLLMLDHTNASYDTLCHLLLNQLQTSQYPELQDILNTWSGTHHINDLAPGIFYVWLNKIMYHSCADEFGDEFYAVWLKNHMIKRSYLKFIRYEDNPWWDNVHTKYKESKQDIIEKSFLEAIEEIKDYLGDNYQKWTWDKYHSNLYKHPLGQIKLLSHYFNAGPYISNGGNESPLNQLIHLDSTLHLEVYGGAAVRRIIDMAHPDSSWNVLPTGNSGNPLSMHYKDQAELYHQGKFRPQLKSKNSMNKMERTLVIHPAQ